MVHICDPAHEDCARHMVPDSIDHLLLVYAAYLVAVASPGPSTMRIMGTAMHHGRRAALLVAAGVVTGSIFWGVVAATGVAAVLTRFAEFLIVLKMLGGLYLIYLAFRAGRSAMTSDDRQSARDGARGAAPAAAYYRQGLLMHLTNPKSVLGWIALVALGLGPEAASETVVVILAGCAVLAIAVFGGYAIVFSTAPMVRVYGRARRWIEGFLAALFALAGLRLLFSRI